MYMHRRDYDLIITTFGDTCTRCPVLSDPLPSLACLADRVSAAAACLQSPLVSSQSSFFNFGLGLYAVLILTMNYKVGGIIQVVYVYGGALMCVVVLQLRAG